MKIFNEGAGIGSIVSDIINEIMGMFFLGSVLKPMGFKLIEAFRPKFSRDVMFTSL
jgi:hypothetical protein